jgi:hypothetical protein
VLVCTLGACATAPTPTSTSAVTTDVAATKPWYAGTGSVAD